MGNLADRVFLAAKELGMDLALADIAERLENDTKPKIWYAYLFAETVDNQDSSFKAARRLQEQDLAKMFYIPDGTPTNIGYPGYSAWITDAARFVGHPNIFRLEIKTGELNTMTEAKSLVNLAGMRPAFKWSYLVAPPFHILRAYMTAASEEIRQGTGLSLFSFPGDDQPWDELASHSQGTLVDTRANLLKIHEMQRRIGVYPNILRARDILDYTDRRTVPVPGAK